MVTSEIVYLGNLRTECTHVASGSNLFTDAPTDNKGKGEYFSPTDLVASAYASCMLTIMGIYCQEHGLEMKHARAEVKKIMASDPRRIGRIELFLDLKGNGWSEDQAERIIRAGKACPVAKSINQEVEIQLNIEY